MTYIICFIVGIIVILGIIIAINIFNLKDINSKLNISLNKLKDLFDKETEILKKQIAIINDEKLTEGFKIENTDIFLYDNELYKKRMIINNFINDMELNNELEKYEKELVIIEESMEGLKDFYNSNAKNYNFTLYKKPFAIIYKLIGLKEKKTFQHKKITELEILKD